MTTRNKIALTAIIALTLVVSVRTYLAFRAAPQLPASEEVYKTVDALFTAVTAHDSRRLASCEERLKSYKDRGSLPAAAAKRLNRIIGLANTGDWNTAARQLYDFIQAQQRRAVPTPRSRPQLTAMKAH
jgi:hypothetical protein